MPEASGKVLVAMSGGVDSSAAAALLLDAGYDVTGVFLCLHAGVGAGRDVGACCSPKDAEDAARVAEALGIELIRLPVADAFEPIIADFAAEYARGRTPNPCIHCNRLIKFGRLFDLADSLGARCVATGHYARMGRDDAGRPAILRGACRAKDQSYALFSVAPERLGRILLPIGGFEAKDRVRQIAREAALPVHDKSESQDICFVSEAGHRDLLAVRAPQALRGGDIVSSDGRRLGTHDGYGLFTIGQRRGLRVAAGEPRYITRIDAATATVTIGPRAEIQRTELTASGAVWHAETPEEFDATVQIRYNHRGAPGRVTLLNRDPAGRADRFAVHFEKPVEAVTPGQAAVLYIGDRLVGGGWID